MQNNHRKPRRRQRSFHSAAWLQQTHYALRNLIDYTKHNALSTLLTLLVIAISLALPTIVYLLWKNSHEAAQQWYPTPNLTVYVSTSLNDDQSQALQRQINALSQVESSIYLSREEALQEFRDWSGFGDAVDLLDENPLPAVIVVTPTDAALQTSPELSELQSAVKQLHGVESLKMDSSWFSRLTALTGMVGQITFALSIMMIIAVFLVISNSVRLNIFARCDTIRVMQLIGATEGFIYRPFLYSGAFFGFIGAILAIVLALLFVWQIDIAIAKVSILFGTEFSIKGLSLEESLLVICLSTFIGWISAWIATTKYLKAHDVS